MFKMIINNIHHFFEIRRIDKEIKKLTNDNDSISWNFQFEPTVSEKEDIRLIGILRSNEERIGTLTRRVRLLKIGV